MKRRALLAGLVAASAGCLNEPSGALDEPTDDQTTNESGTTSRGTESTTGTDETTDGATETTDDARTADGETETGEESTASDDAYRPDWAFDGDAATTVSVGSRDDVAFADTHRPWSVALWNDTGGSVDLGVVVERAGTQVVDRTLTVEAGAWVKVKLLAPGDYRVAASVDGERRWSKTWTASDFDCNSHFTQVALGPGGAMRARSGGTAAACGAPGVSGATLDAGDGDCASGEDPGHEAAVAFEDETVVVDGAVHAPTPCYALAVEEAASTDDGTELTVVVAATRERGTCVECVGRVPYSLTVDLHTAYPERVVVEHVVDGERTVVARVDR